MKSPPELWAEISDERALARRLDALGEIRITRLEPETAVAWEGDSVRGTVALEPSGWGTKVTLTAQADTQPCVEVPTEPEPEPQFAPDPRPHTTATEPAPDPQTLPAAPTELPVRPAPAAPEPDEPDPLPPAARRSRFAFLRRLLGRRRQAPTPATGESLAEAPPAPDEITPPTAPQVARTEPPEIEPTVAVAAKPEASPSRKVEASTFAAGEHAVPADETAASADETAATPADEAAEASAPAVPDGGALDLRVLDERHVAQILTAVLDDLGAAHHRPFSRG
ncbi:MAG: hypothetical protein LT070_06070 [Solirubrobacteraceae bacterium]|nr:hypothetical protein [Solirubrobacteraceae bacterium]